MLTPDLTAAAAVAARGLAVFPLEPGGRRPACSGWQLAATPAPASWPAGANIGVACRASGVVVLDLDVKNGDDGLGTFSWWLARHREQWPNTLTVATPSGGRHVYYRAPAGHVVVSSSGGATRLGPGIDVRAPGRRTGGWTVGPDSQIGGARYEVVRDAPVRDLPGWLVPLLRPRRLSSGPTTRTSVGV
ncbi:bifunctional DNA primase/polymerase [Streptomyces subrutilus]|uniref:DNA primase/polymerase bifunctional N-terminal domain-containing protein n=1 Tax=Streptomyces subrutilus TaxID=36818 RepID=A0A1E5NXS6_9ACTN|nr:bifunctional DNA primase/polymerase [Streptomyces subrutilus]OEJ21068.1 hypothetical protein BGK67_34815 [Streptomyces subrutilus]